MSATTATTGHGVTFGGVLRSEWIKLLSLRSTFWCSLIIVVLSAGFTALPLAVPDVSRIPTGDQFTAFTVSSITLSTGFTSLVAAVLGTLMITGEFGTGMIRSTFAAVPQRIPALVGKAVVVTVFMFLVGIVSVGVSILVALAVISARGLDLTGDAGFWWAMLGEAGYLALIGLLALVVGTIIRNTAGGIATSLGIILVLPIVANLLANLANQTWAQNVGSFLPSNAGSRMFAYGADQQVTAAAGSGIVELDAWQGLLVMAVWIVVVGIVAGVLLRRRDA